MHLPDTLTPPVIAGTMALSAAAIAGAARRLAGEVTEERAPLVGVLGAFVFAAQMVNFPIPGSSAHLGGAALLTLLLGPSIAIVTMSAVLVIQAFLFQDGAVLSLGANIWNLGVVPALVSHAIFRLVNPRAARGLRLRVAALAGSWVGLVAGAACAGWELHLSGHTDFFSKGIVTVFAWIGLGEAAATVLCLEAIHALAPGTFRAAAEERRP